MAGVVGEVVEGGAGDAVGSGVVGLAVGGVSEEEALAVGEGVAGVAGEAAATGGTEGAAVGVGQFAPVVGQVVALVALLADVAVVGFAVDINETGHDAAATGWNVAVGTLQTGSGGVVGCAAVGG